MIASAIRRIVDRESLTSAEMHDVFGEMMDGKATDAQKAALLIGLRMKGETAEEITGAAQAMRARVTSLEIDSDLLVDTCGTGGDGHATFNVSTVAAIVAASAGAPVAKHGNRAVSSACGSADVLAALGVNIDLTAQQMKTVLEKVGIAFLFAPKLHPAMAAVSSVRRELGVRSIFNILGPLTNPAFARRQVLGVFARPLVETVAAVLASLGAQHALVVHSDDGMDEISISAPTLIAEVREGIVIDTRTIVADQLGLDSHPIETLRGGDAETNARIASSILTGERGGPREVVLANAGAALYVAGLAPTIAEGAKLAASAIDGGKARATLSALVQASHEVAR